MKGNTDHIHQRKIAQLTKKSTLSIHKQASIRQEQPAGRERKRENKTDEQK